MADLAGYRTKIGLLLASAVDSSTWTTDMLDQGVRMALDELNELLVYEATFTVSSAGYEQDLSGVTDLFRVLALAYPWADGREFGQCLATWRLSGVNKAYFEQVEPQVGDEIRVRYLMTHKVEDLDSAVATTVPSVHEDWVQLVAAVHAAGLRVRQISENPAVPKDAAHTLRALQVVMRQRADNAMAVMPPIGRLRWGSVGL